MKKTILSEEEIIHLGKLASMTLNSKEIKRFQKQLTETLDYVKNLQELDTSQVAATDHTVEVKNVFFEDGEKNTRRLAPEEALLNAKNKKNNYFIVKRIL